MEKEIKGGTIIGVWDEPKKPKEEKAEEPKKKKTK